MRKDLRRPPADTVAAAAAAVAAAAALLGYSACSVVPPTALLGVLVAQALVRAFPAFSAPWYSAAHYACTCGGREEWCRPAEDAAAAVQVRAASVHTRLAVNTDSVRPRRRRVT